MPLGYRSLMSVPTADNIFDLVAEQRDRWLAHKRLDANAVTEGAVELRAGITAQLLDRTGDDGTRTSRFTLIERKTAGAWTVRITTHARVGASPWVLVDVVTPDRANGPTPASTNRVGIPGFLPWLLDAIRAYDGGTPLRRNPLVAGPGDLDTVIDAICDPDRRGLLLVTGTPPSSDPATWRAFVKDRLSDAVGVCTAYVLDHAATVELQKSLDEHAPPMGCFRTYLPDADPASASDARRHRIMTARTLAQRSSDYVRHVLAKAARAQVVGLSLPPDVAAIDRLVAQWETEALLEVPAAPTLSVPAATGSTARPAIADEAAVYLALNDAVHSLVGDVPLDANAVRLVTAAAGRASQLELALERARSAIDDYQDQVEHVRAQERELRAEIERLELEQAIDTEHMIELEERVRYLRKVLMRRGDGAEAWTEIPDRERAEPPETMADLVQRLEEFTHIRFTGDREKALELDDLDTWSLWAKKAWLALRALDDYARLRVTGTFTGTVYDYCRRTPDDCQGWSAERHAPDESDGTKNNPKFAAARMLPVPPEVDPSGEVFMGAHFKIAASGSVSPRMHYYDDTGRSGFVYVGYLGRHLPNARTN